MPKRPTSKKTAPASRKKPVRKATPARRVKAAKRQAKEIAVHRFERARPARTAAAQPRALGIEIDPQRVDETLARFKSELMHWANKGRYTRVRFKFRGKQLLPDLPLAAVVAAEGLTFYWGGILRALIMNVAGKTVFDVELVNDADKRILKGKEELLSGDVDRALSCFREAVAMDRDNARAHLNLGVALKLKGDPASARKSLELAQKLAGDGPLAGEATRLLAGLSPNAVVDLVKTW